MCYLGVNSLDTAQMIDSNPKVKSVWDETLWRQLTPELFNFIYKLCGNYHVAEDLLQDTLVKGLSYQDRNPGQQFGRPWIFKIALNTVRNHRRRRNEPAAADVSALPAPAAAEGPKQEALAALRLAMNKLPDEQREVLVLRKFQRLGYREISDITGVSEGTLKARLHYAIEKLRQWMGDMDLE